MHLIKRASQTMLLCWCFVSVPCVYLCIMLCKHYAIRLFTNSWKWGLFENEKHLCALHKCFFFLDSLSFNIFHVQYRYGNSIVYIVHEIAFAIWILYYLHIYVSFAKFLLIFFPIFFFSLVSNRSKFNECVKNAIYTMYYYAYNILVSVCVCAAYPRNLLKFNFFFFSYSNLSFLFWVKKE